MSEGCIKLHRSITERKDYFSIKTLCWIDLLLLAQWQDTRVFYKRGIKVELQRGEIAMSYDDFAERWRMNRKTVMKYIKELELAGMITIKKSKVINVITIVNYSKYQNVDYKTDYKTDAPTDCNSDSNDIAVDYKTNATVDYKTDYKTDAPTDCNSDSNDIAVDYKTNATVDYKTDYKTDYYLNNSKERKETKENIVVVDAHTREENENFFNQFFCEYNQSQIEQFAMSQSISIEELKKSASDIVNEWNLSQEQHRDYNDWVRHLLNQIRVKIKNDKIKQNYGNRNKVIRGGISNLSDRKRDYHKKL